MILLVLIILVLVGLIFVSCTGGTPSGPVPPQPPRETLPLAEREEMEAEIEEPEVVIEISATPASAEVDFYAVKASISGTWDIEYGNSRITISEDSHFEINWDNTTIISGQYTIARDSEMDYRLTLLPNRVRNISANQPEFGSPSFDDEELNSSHNWIQQEIIINPSNRNILGFVGHDGTVEWANIGFTPEVLWLEDKI